MDETTQGARFTRWLLAAVVLFAAAGAFATAMTVFNHNEHMYLSASLHLTQGLLPYRDFAYLQTPYLPFLYAGLFRLLHLHTHYLMAAKLLSFAFLMASALLIFLAARRASRCAASAAAIAALFLLNLQVAVPAAEISNYAMPMAFSLGALLAFVAATDSATPRLGGLALAGFLAAIAIGAKLTYAPLALPLALAIHFRYRTSHPGIPTQAPSRPLALAAFATGLVAGLLPLMILLASDPSAFLFNNLGFHHLNARWRASTGYGEAMTLLAKIAYARAMLLRPDNLLLLVGILLGWSWALSSPEHPAERIRRLPLPAKLSAALVAVALVAAIAPTPSFPQYYLMPVSLLYPLFAYAGSPREVNGNGHFARLLAVLLLLSLAHSAPLMLRSMAQLSSRSGWAALHLHDTAQRLAHSVVSNGGQKAGKVATLSPILAWEAGMPTYRELATGSFLFRVGDLLDEEDRKRFVGSSPGSLAALLAADPPAAIVVGFEASLDRAFTAFAREHNYRPVQVDGVPAPVYVAP
jgi:hypothetical protein